MPYEIFFDDWCDTWCVATFANKEHAIEWEEAHKDEAPVSASVWGRDEKQNIWYYQAPK